MTEPATTAAGSILGIKYGTLIAGTIGGVLSLRYLENLSLPGRLFAIAAGVALAGYGTPALDAWLDLPDSIENAVAFLLGLSAMNLIPGFIKITEQFSSQPFATVRKFLSIKHDDTGGGDA